MFIEYTILNMIETGVFNEYFYAIDRNTLKITNFNHFGPREQMIKNSTIANRAPVHDLWKACKHCFWYWKKNIRFPTSSYLSHMLNFGNLAYSNWKKAIVVKISALKKFFSKNNSLIHLMANACYHFYCMYWYSLISKVFYTLVDIVNY